LTINSQIKGAVKIAKRSVSIIFCKYRGESGGRMYGRTNMMIISTVEIITSNMAKRDNGLGSLESGVVGLFIMPSGFMYEKGDISP
jgi:hypothetical protein